MGLSQAAALSRPLARALLERPARCAFGRQDFLLSETADELSRAPADSTRARSLLHAGKVYIRNTDGSEELYDRTTDPAESHDLSKTSEAAALLACFREQMKSIDQQAVAEFERLRSQAKGSRRQTASARAAAAHQTLSACAFEELD